MGMRHHTRGYPNGRNMLFSPFKRLAKVESALMVGLLLLMSTSLGLIGPQNATLNFFGTIKSNVLVRDIFFSWWYLSLEILLAISLVSCSFLDQFFVLRCQSNTTKKLKRVTLSINHDLLQENVQISQIKKGASKISGSSLNILQQGVLRDWAPLGVHMVVTAMVTYGALDMLYSFKGSTGISVGEGLFLSESGSQQSSSAHIRPLAYYRVNDAWALTDPYQPFLDVSFLAMDGKECDRFTMTASSQSVLARPDLLPERGIRVDGSLSLGSLTPRRIRLAGQKTHWELPVLVVGRSDQSSSSWLASGLEDEVLTGWEGGWIVLSGDNQGMTWDQQDFFEKPNSSRFQTRLVEVLYEANMTWSSKELSVEIFFVPLLTVLIFLVIPSRDIFLEVGQHRL